MASRGGRQRTGTVIKLKDGRLQGIITLADGGRKRLPPFPKGTSEAMAREKTAYYAELATKKGREPPESRGARSGAMTQGTFNGPQGTNATRRPRGTCARHKCSRGASEPPSLPCQNRWSKAQPVGQSINPIDRRLEMW